MKRLSFWKSFHFLFILLPAAITFGQQPSVTPSPQSDTGFPEHSPEQIHLGQLLFFDKILSGNRNISCATCHHPLSSTGDGLALGIGEGGRGLGPTRHLVGVSPAAFEVQKRIPRNAPALFNLGHQDFQVLFHDGRVEAGDHRSPNFKSPAKDKLPPGLESTLAAQAMFPVTSKEEMAGEPGSNPVADAAAQEDFAGPNGVWERLAQRIREIPEYVSLFQRAYPQKIVSASQITFVDVANAIAAFESATWRADNSAFDRFMGGDKDCMSRDAREGMTLFLGKGQCANCHTGRFQTDHRFHSIAMPQIGPGKGDGPTGRGDYGRERVTKRASDRYKFRTPSLRNVALTAPYGHNGAYPDLKSVILHHLQPSVAVANYNPGNARMPNTQTPTLNDLVVMRNPSEVREIVGQSDISRITLTDQEVDLIIEFLHCLTDPSSLNLLKDVPHRVPSHLPMFD